LVISPIKTFGKFALELHFLFEQWMKIPSIVMAKQRDHVIPIG